LHPAPPKIKQNAPLLIFVSKLAVIFKKAQESTFLSFLFAAEQNLILEKISAIGISDSAYLYFLQ